MQTQKKKIIIIDDEQVCLLGMEMLLFGTEFELETILGGEEALKYLFTYPKVDLIFLDLMMPEIDGVKIIEAIINDEALKKIPVVIQTGIVSEQVNQKMLSLGAVEVLKKPYNKQMVLEILHNYIS